MVNSDGDAVSFAYPFRRGADGKVETNVQGTPEHTFSRVQVVAHYPKGYRVDRPDFGITFPDFENAPIDSTLLASEIEAQVPEADYRHDEYADIADEAIRHVSIEVTS